MQLRIGIADTLANPLVDEHMLGCNLIVTGCTANRRYGSADVIGTERGNAVLRRGGVAVIVALSPAFAEAKLADRHTVPDPVVLVVVKGSSKALDRAAKERGATVIDLLPGYAAMAVGTNTIAVQKIDLDVIDKGKRKRAKAKPPPPPAPKPEAKSDTPAAEPETPAPAPAPEAPKKVKGGVSQK